MARNRIIYQSEALFAGQKTNTDITDAHTDIGDGDPSTAHIKQIHRVQSANYAFNISRSDVNQFGELAAIDRVVLDTPTVSLDFSYLLSNFENEARLGFHIDQLSTTYAGLTSALSGMLSKTADERNYFIQTSKEGQDAVGESDADRLGGLASTIGIGNGFITSYSTEASVGGFPTVSVAAEGMNMLFQTGVVDVANPAINRVDGSTPNTKIKLPTVSGSAGSADEASGILSISTLRPGDITMKFAENDGTSAFNGGEYGLGGAKLPTAAGDTTNSANIQSYNISFDLGRTPIQRLGNRFAFAREIDFPVNVSLSVDAIMTDLTTGNLNDLIDCDKSYNVEIELKGITGSACDSDKTTVCKYILKDVKPDAQSYSSSIGDNKTVTLDFSAQIGGPNQANVGLFMQGVTQTNSADLTGPTFTVSQIASAGAGGFSNSTTGDFLFSFTEPIFDADGNDLVGTDFRVAYNQNNDAQNAGGLVSAGTIVNSTDDKVFLLRAPAAKTDKMVVGTIVTGFLGAATYKDAQGNQIGATGTHAQTATLTAGGASA